MMDLSMWKCGPCGCQGIAGDLGVCPQCGEERAMPKSTSGGASNAWEQGEPDESAAEAQPAPVAAEEPGAPDAETAATVQGEHGPELTDLPLATGGVIEPGTAPVVGDDPPGFILPPGWTTDPGAPAVSEPTPSEPDQTEASPAQPPAQSPPD